MASSSSGPGLSSRGGGQSSSGLSWSSSGGDQSSNGLRWSSSVLTTPRACPSRLHGKDMTGSSIVEHLMHNPVDLLEVVWSNNITKSDVIREGGKDGFWGES